MIHSTDRSSLSKNTHCIYPQALFVIFLTITMKSSRFVIIFLFRVHVFPHRIMHVKLPFFQSKAFAQSATFNYYRTWCGKNEKEPYGRIHSSIWRSARMRTACKKLAAAARYAERRIYCMSNFTTRAKFREAI